MKTTLITFFSFFLILSSCEKENEKIPEIPFIEPELQFNSRDSLYVYRYQNDSNIRYYYNKISNPDSVIFRYFIEFSGSEGYIVLIFSKTFNINELENPNEYFIDIRNNDNINVFSGDLFEGYYKLHENEILKLFNSSNTKITGYNDAYGISFYHSEFLYMDSSNKIISEGYESDLKLDSSSFVFQQISKVSDFTTDFEDYDLLQSELYEDRDYIFHIKAIFEVNLINSDSSEIVKIHNGKVEFVVLAR